MRIQELENHNSSLEISLSDLQKKNVVLVKEKATLVSRSKNENSETRWHTMNIRRLERELKAVRGNYENSLRDFRSAREKNIEFEKAIQRYVEENGALKKKRGSFEKASAGFASERDRTEREASKAAEGNS